MGNVRLDHFITAVTVENVDDYMEERVPSAEYRVPSD